MGNLDHSDGDFRVMKAIYYLFYLRTINVILSVSTPPTMVHKHMGAPLNGTIKM